MSAQKPILIAGAGLSSLLLGQSLLRSKIPFHIFERDASISFRAQGYRLRLSSEGLDAIESVLGPEDFPKFWAICGKTKANEGGVGWLDAVTGEKMTSPVGPEKAEKEKEEEEDGKKEKPKDIRLQLTSRDGLVVGISRGDMRKFFMRGCEDLVQWSHHVTGYEMTDSGVVAIFADGTKSVEGSMLVGGEGVYSKVAKQLSGGKLKTYDTGARGIHGQAPSTVFAGLGEGVWILTDKSNPAANLAVITNVRSGDKDDPSIQLGWTMMAAPGLIKAPNDDYSTIGKPAADLAKAFTANWHPRYKPLFENMVESEAAFWKVTCSTPSGVPGWNSKPRVTAIGDAVHSMTPAGGIGANTALRDSALLGRLLGEAGGFGKGVTAAYEKEMRIYGSEAVASSYRQASMQWKITIDETKDV